MVNTKSLFMGLALTLSATALPVEQQQAANCKVDMSGTTPTGTAVAGNTATSTLVKNDGAVTSIAGAIQSIIPTAIGAPQATSTAASGSKLTAAQLTTISPATASCAGADTECADAAHAAPAIVKSFDKYGFTAPGVQAALIAVMLFESADFKYNKNKTPGRPGQGTRNMQMAPFNIKYATALNIAGAVAATEATVLDLLSTDDLSFGSAAWYLSTQCPASIAKGLEDGSVAGWDAYLVSCLQTTHDPARDPYWTKAKAALGVAA
ncbi:hypothetical protein P280DRAFT_472856 [Massarina eburnea CBS 473.64]|uniref:Uncharacterized protein n=1 Tax=Massarina eburnea CBS 473.64 TaxID=1395130 RepID=A0A6A6RMP8_9PLEO|nr:hypothetical protein P280DRAFT_472856 [Massarina eburnea CBS 473.64]